MTVKILHDGGNSAEDPPKRIFLCYTQPRQYDPVYELATIVTSGMIQSIVYEILYAGVLGLPDAYEAANQMLNGEFDPRFGKPDVYDKEFRGTAMEALESFLIPFPYKVAKALDPEMYR